MSYAPPYYTMPDGTDLYDRWRQQYGAYATTEHLLMSAQEYLARCLHKGQYERDLRKASVILQRLLDWYQEIESPPRQELGPQDEAALAEQLRHAGWTVYRAHNGEVLSPAPRPSVLGNNGVPTQDGWTVSMACLAQDEKRLGRKLTTEECLALGEELKEHSIPASGLYLDHAPALARRMPMRFPLFPAQQEATP